MNVILSRIACLLVYLGALVLPGTAIGAETATLDYTANLGLNFEGNVGDHGQLRVDGNGDFFVLPPRYSDQKLRKHRGSDGALLWEWVFPGTPVGLMVTQENDVIATGQVQLLEGGNLQQFYAARINGETGQKMWESRIPRPVNATDAECILDNTVINEAGDLILAGRGFWSNEGAVTQMASLGASDGALRWQRSGVALYGQSVAGVPLALDAAGNVYVGNDAHGLVTKYAATDGQQLWQRAVEKIPGYESIEVFRLITTPAGDVVFCGAAKSPGWKGLVQKLSTDDGAPLWSYLLEGVSDLRFMDVAVDAVGDVCAVSFYGVLVKLDGASGRLVWRARLAGNSALSEGLEFDAAGNPIMVAYGSGNPAISLLAAKFDGRSGLLMWKSDLAPPPGFRYSVRGHGAIAQGPNNISFILGVSRPMGSWETDGRVFKCTAQSAGISFADWATEEELTGSDASATADPDQDGLSNAEEFLYGTDPLSGADLSLTDARPTLAIASDGVTLTYRRNPLRDLSAFGYEATSDLNAPWLPVTPAFIEDLGPIEGTPVRRTRVTFQPPVGAESWFVRLLMTP